MNMNQLNAILIAVLLVAVIIGCAKMAKQSTENVEEESGAELALNQTYDKVRNGVRLIMNYNAQNNTFEGTIENTTDETLKQVRVEAHLSNGKELGPTPSVDLASGEKTDVQLIAKSKDFDRWTAHPEVGEGEHSHGKEHGEHDSEHRGEHDREGEKEHNRKGEGEEESGAKLALNQTYDKVRNGVRLIMNYNAQNNTFEGTIENTTDETLKQVRVEAHLSNGKELGPTKPDDLASGEKREVQLNATSTDFDGWTAHPEVGEGEHSHGKEHGEHDSEHRGEHNRKGEGEHN